MKYNKVIYAVVQQSYKWSIIELYMDYNRVVSSVTINFHFYCSGIRTSSKLMINE